MPMTVDFSSVTTEARRKWHIFQVLNGKNLSNPQSSTYQKYPSEMNSGGFKIFSMK